MVKRLLSDRFEGDMTKEARALPLRECGRALSAVTREPAPHPLDRLAGLFSRPRMSSLIKSLDRVGHAEVRPLARPAPLAAVSPQEEERERFPAPASRSSKPNCASAI